MIDIQKAVRSLCIQLDEFGDKYISWNYHHNLFHKHIHHQNFLPPSLFIIIWGVGYRNT